MSKHMILLGQQISVLDIHAPNSAAWHNTLSVVTRTCQKTIHPSSQQYAIQVLTPIYLVSTNYNLDPSSTSQECALPSSLLFQLNLMNNL